MSPRFVGCAVAMLAVAAGAGPVAGQGFRWPENPENLQVLEVSGARLGSVMRGFAGALDVRCEYCHVGTDPADLTTFDFPSDEKSTKRKARLMLRMVGEINDRLLAGLSDLGVADDERVRVTCVTCHRGNSQPVLIQDVVDAAIEEEGIAAAEAKYRELREQYFGGFVYDFLPGPLSGLAEDRASRGDVDGAVALLELEIEFHPASFSSWFTLSQVLEQANRAAESITALEKALEYAPDQFRAFLQRRLDERRSR